MFFDKRLEELRDIDLLEILVRAMRFWRIRGSLTAIGLLAIITAPTVMILIHY